MDYLFKGTFAKVSNLFVAALFVLGVSMAFPSNAYACGCEDNHDGGGGGGGDGGYHYHDCNTVYEKAIAKTMYEFKKLANQINKAIASIKAEVTAVFFLEVKDIAEDSNGTKCIKPAVFEKCFKYTYKPRAIEIAKMEKEIIATEARADARATELATFLVRAEAKAVEPVLKDSTARADLLVQQDAVLKAAGASAEQLAAAKAELEAELALEEAMIGEPKAAEPPVAEKCTIFVSLTDIATGLEDLFVKYDILNINILLDTLRCLGLTEEQVQKAAMTIAKDDLKGKIQEVIGRDITEMAFVDANRAKAAAPADVAFTKVATKVTSALSVARAEAVKAAEADPAMAKAAEPVKRAEAAEMMVKLVVDCAVIEDICAPACQEFRYDLKISACDRTPVVYAMLATEVFKGDMKAAMAACDGLAVLKSFATPEEAQAGLDKGNELIKNYGFDSKRLAIEMNKACNDGLPPVCGKGEISYCTAAMCGCFPLAEICNKYDPNYPGCADLLCKSNPDVINIQVQLADVTSKIASAKADYDACMIRNAGFCSKCPIEYNNLAGSMNNKCNISTNAAISFPACFPTAACEQLAVCKNPVIEDPNCEPEYVKFTNAIMLPPYKDCISARAALDQMLILKCLNTASLQIGYDAMCSAAAK